MKKAMTTIIVGFAIVATVIAMTGTQEERLDALEYCSRITHDNLVDYQAMDQQTKLLLSEDSVRRRYQMTHDELLCDIRALVGRYSPAETNRQKRSCREHAIMLIGRYGSTNDLEFLSGIWGNNDDYAQRTALGTAMSLARNSEILFDISREVLTNSTYVASPKRMRNRVYTTLYSFASPGEDRLTNEVQVARIASFFLERAAEERNDSILFVDWASYMLTPSYRHSQQRRDNLAAARPPALTGRRAELYDAAQRDAAQED